MNWRDDRDACAKSLATRPSGNRGVAPNRHLSVFCLCVARARMVDPMSQGDQPIRSTAPRYRSTRSAVDHQGGWSANGATGEGPRTGALGVMERRASPYRGVSNAGSSSHNCVFRFDDSMGPRARVGLITSPPHSLDGKDSYGYSDVQ